MTDQEFDEFFEELKQSRNNMAFNLTEKTILRDFNRKIFDAKLILRELIKFRDMDEISEDDKTEQYLIIFKKLIIIENLATSLNFD